MIKKINYENKLEENQKKILDKIKKFNFKQN